MRDNGLRYRFGRADTTGVLDPDTDAFVESIDFAPVVTPDVTLRGRAPGGLVRPSVMGNGVLDVQYRIIGDHTTLHATKTGVVRGIMALAEGADGPALRSITYTPNVYWYGHDTYAAVARQLVEDTGVTVSADTHAMFEFNETSGSTATDANGGRVATHGSGVTVGAASVMVSGRGASASYDGTANGVTTIPYDSLVGSALWSAAVSIYSDAYAANTQVLCNISTGPTNGWELFLDASKYLTLRIWSGGSSTTFVHPFACANGTRYHVFMYWDGTRMCLIVNGLQLTPATGAFTPNTGTAMLVAKDTAAVRAGFVGRIDNLLIDGGNLTQRIMGSPLLNAHYGLYVLYGYLMSSAGPTADGSTMRGQFQVATSRPYAEDYGVFYTGSTYDEVAAAGISAPGVTVPLTIPAVVSDTVFGYLEYPNVGDATVYPVVRMYGPVVNPRLTAYVGYGSYPDARTVRMLGSIAAGDYWEIDLFDKTVLLNGATAVAGAVDPAESEWFGLPPGMTQLYATAESATSGSSFGVLHTSAYS